jgi:hypothetical protein
MDASLGTSSFTALAHELPAGSWGNINGTVTAPANAVTADIYISITTGVVNSLYIDDVTFTQCPMSVSDVSVNAATKTVTYTISNSPSYGQSTYAKITEGSMPVRSVWLGVKTDGTYTYTWDSKYDNGTEYTPNTNTLVTVYASLTTGKQVFFKNITFSSWPTGVCMDPTGNIYAMLTANRIDKAYVNGTISTFYNGGSLGCMAADSQGNIYYVNIPSNYVYKIYPNGTRVAPNTYPNSPWVADDNSDNVY